jgi:hypothetical protein
MEPVMVLFVLAVGMAASLACGLGAAAALAGCARRLMQRAPIRRARSQDVVSTLRASGGL